MPMSESVRMLVVDDDEMIRDVLTRVAEDLGWSADTAASGGEAIDKCRAGGDYQVCLLDVRMPGISGIDALPEILKHSNELAVLILTGHADVDASVRALKLGAYDFLLKPVDLMILEQRIIKALEWRSHRLERKRYLREVETLAAHRANELDAVRRAIIFGLVRLTGCRDGETGLHLARMQRYCVEIAKGLRDMGLHRSTLTDQYLDDLFESAPLHDVGKIGIPDAILRKPGALTPEEREVMMEHTTIGHEALLQIREKVGTQTFLDLGIEIAGHHHERWDGSGYPKGLKGHEIPLSARITALADVYDAMTVSRIYRAKPYPYADVIDYITANRGKHFDPDVVEAFLHSEQAVRSIKEELV
ncbi:MAG: response regulator [Candidatus Sumerlaeia bacterium]|nr:response regulator [Candidatus Sumerlaeia bacterium]